MHGWHAVHDSRDTTDHAPPTTDHCCATLSIVRKVLVGALIGLAAAAVAGLLGLTPFLQTVELKTYDWRVARTANPAAARQDIVLVAIDNESIRELEPHVGRWPWPRLIHAHLINFLSRGGARLIVYDVLFSERDRRSFTRRRGGLDGPRNPTMRWSRRRRGPATSSMSRR